MSVKDRQQALARVKILAAYTNAVIKALGAEGVANAA